MRKLGILAAACAAAVVYASAAQAAVTTFSDRSAFNAASSIRVNDAYENTPTGQSTDYHGLYKGDGYTAKGNALFLVGADPAIYPAFYDWGSGDVMVHNLGGSTTFTFDAPVHAVGLDLMTIVAFGRDVVVEIDGFQQVVSTADFGTRTFFGLTSDKGFSTFKISTPTAIGLFDNLSFGGLSSAVPEPSTWAMLIAGFGGVGAMMRRQRRRLMLA